MPTSSRSPSPSTSIRARCGQTAGRALVEAWRGSGLAPAEFARRQGVSAQLLRYWRLRFPEATGFTEIPAPTTAAISRSTGDPPTMVVEVGPLCRVHVKAGFDPALLRAVVAALSYAGASC